MEAIEGLLEEGVTALRSYTAISIYLERVLLL